MYWGHAQAFTGGFFGELSMLDIINQAKIREENEESDGSRSSKDSDDTDLASGGDWGRPINMTPSGGEVFGYPRGGGKHDGVDYSAAVGHKIRAVHGGTVTRVGQSPEGWRQYIGGVIVVKSKDGYQEVYQEFGLLGGGGKAYVHKGQKVKTGEVIAKLGSKDTEVSTSAWQGAHVHIGISKRSVFKAQSGSSTKGWYDLEKLIKDSKK